MNTFKRILSFKQFGVILAALLLILIFGIMKPVFISGYNFSAILRYVGFIGIAAIGESLVMISGEFDLSIGSVAGFISALTCVIMWKLQIGENIPVYFKGATIPIIIGLLIAALVGLINGLLVVKLKMHAFIVTIGMFYIAKGLQEVILQGKSFGPPDYPLSESFINMGKAEPLRLSIAFFVFIVLIILFELILRNTAYGKNIFATGTESNVAKLLGINSGRVKIIAFVISAFLAGLEGIFVAANLRGAAPMLGKGLELQAIAAAVIGGIAVFGGSGSMIGTFFGIFILGLLTNGLSIIDIPTYWQNIVYGVILVIAVYYDTLRRQRGSSKSISI